MNTKPPSAAAEPEFTKINWSSTLRLVVWIDVVVPCTVKSPVKVKLSNVGESACCRPVSRSVLTPFIVALTVPWLRTLNVEPDINDLPFNVPMLARLVAIPVAKLALKLDVAAFNSASEA